MNVKHKRSMMKGDVNKLITFERKVLRLIKYGPNCSNFTQRYEIRHNKDSRNLFIHPNFVVMVKSKRIRWFYWVYLEGKKK